MAGSPQYFDLITTGRTGVDLYPLETGVPLARAETSGKFPGGPATDVAVAAARKGRSTAVTTRTGGGPFGTSPHEVLEESGADDHWVAPYPASPYATAGSRVSPGAARVGAAAPGERRNSSGPTVSDLDARPCYREALPEAGAEPAVVERGSRVALAVHRDGTRAEVPPVPAEVVNGLGACDAFGGPLCHGPLAGRDLERTMRHAHAAGALVASHLACSSAMPTEPEVADLLARAASPGAAGRPSQS